MKSMLMTSAAVLFGGALLAGCAGYGMGGSREAPAAETPKTTESRFHFPITAQGAADFVADAEKRLAELSEYVARVQWTRATYITYDTMWLESRANAQYTELQVELANDAARFKDVAGLAPDVDRGGRHHLDRDAHSGQHGLAARPLPAGAQRRQPRRARRPGDPRPPHQEQVRDDGRAGAEVRRVRAPLRRSAHAHRTPSP